MHKRGFSGFLPPKWWNFRGLEVIPGKFVWKYTKNMSILAIDQQKSGLEALKRSASIHQDCNFWDFSLLEANLPTGRIREFWTILIDLVRFSSQNRRASTTLKSILKYFYDHKESPGDRLETWVADQTSTKSKKVGFWNPTLLTTPWPTIESRDQDQPRSETVSPAAHSKRDPGRLSGRALRKAA